MFEATGPVADGGLAVDRAEYADNVHAIGAPIIDLYDQCVGAISVSFFGQLTAKEMASVEAAVRQAARTVSAQLGQSTGVDARSKAAEAFAAQ